MRFPRLSKIPRPRLRIGRTPTALGTIVAALCLAAAVAIDPGIAGGIGGDTAGAAAAQTVVRRQPPKSRAGVAELHREVDSLVRVNDSLPSIERQRQAWRNMLLADHVRLFGHPMSTHFPEAATAERAIGIAPAVPDSTRNTGSGNISNSANSASRVRVSRLTSAERSAWYGVALSTAVAANMGLSIDRDPGGYRDQWRSQDKLFHATTGFTLAAIAARSGVPNRWAAALTCAAAIGFERTQGYASWRDASASCSGAAIGAAISARRDR